MKELLSSEFINPLRLFTFDVRELKDTEGKPLGTDRTLDDMYVHWMTFAGENSEDVIISFTKERTHTKLFHWKTNSPIGYDTTVPCPQKKETEWACDKRFKVENYDQSIAIKYRGRIVWTGYEWVEAHVISHNGRYLACVPNTEDGDMREDPALWIYDLLPFAASLRYEELKSTLIFQALLKNNRDAFRSVLERGNEEDSSSASSSSFVLVGQQRHHALLLNLFVDIPLITTLIISYI
jgi:hypothetical protein